MTNRFIRPMAACTALAFLAACAGPAEGPLPAGAIPFSQVLSDNSGAPYECLDFEATSNSCVTYGTYTQQADGTYISEAFLLLQDSPRIVARGVAPAIEINGRICSNGSQVAFDVVEGQTNASTEFLLGFIEEFYAGLGQTCAVYVPTSDGYAVTLATQDAFTNGIESSSRFVQSPPRLRSE